MVIPWSCACCTRCAFITEGARANRCIYDGPFTGYIEVADT